MHQTPGNFFLAILNQQIKDCKTGLWLPDRLHNLNFYKYTYNTLRYLILKFMDFFYFPILWFSKKEIRYLINCIKIFSRCFWNFSPDHTVAISHPNTLPNGWLKKKIFFKFFMWKLSFYHGKSLCLNKIEKSTLLNLIIICIRWCQIFIQISHILWI